MLIRIMLSCLECSGQERYLEDLKIFICGQNVSFLWKIEQGQENLLKLVRLYIIQGLF